MAAKRGGIAGALAAGGFGQPSATASAFAEEEAAEVIDAVPPAAPANIEAPPHAARNNVVPAAVALPLEPDPQPRKTAPKRSNRTFRASDDEVKIIDQLRRAIYLDGRCTKMADTSDIVRSALRLAVAMPIDNIVEDLVANADEG